MASGEGASGERASRWSGWNWRRWALAGWALVAAMILLPFAAMFAMAATADDENVVVTRNQVANGVWQGRITNVTEAIYTDVAVQIVFVDGKGEAIGMTRGRVDRLASGQSLELQANLPPGAARMQVYALRWRAGDHNERPVAVGPYYRWDFGYIHREWP